MGYSRGLDWIKKLAGTQWYGEQVIKKLYPVGGTRQGRRKQTHHGNKLNYPQLGGKIDKHV